ncbi:hypothetical protein DJ021_07035 [Phenylobacterium hankyongense]|uniref:Uncharacterized protein n=1 Tax=Phenylobacterium hankyongense TaxID=1813876 RepID=A0A328AWS0_9CAUL|nr:hypothetical protein DJ021_07035 [Phenylobacterium hankyongense]
MAKALNDPDLDPDLRDLIARRVWQLCAEQNAELAEAINFVVIEGGDTPEVINDALGFAITGQHAEEPCYDAIEDHGLWFEISYPPRDGVRTFVFVSNTPATEMGIHYLCLSRVWSDGEGSRQ